MSRRLDLMLLGPSVRVQSAIMVAEELGPGTVVEEAVTVDDEVVRRYGEATGDFNPVHFDDTYAAQTPFGRRIAHGGILFGQFSRILGTRLPGPGTIFLSQRIEFLAPVYVGDAIRCQVQVVELLAKNGAKLTTVAFRGGTIVANGEAVVKLPRKPVEQSR